MTGRRPNKSIARKNRSYRLCRTAARIETMERRQMMSVTLNAAGWSVMTPSSSARVIYVSSSHGNDKNSGLSASAPVQSLAEATSLVRNNSDDEILLDRGETWRTSFPQWTKSGISQQQPLLIGTYGSGNRPVIDTGTGNGLICDTKNAVNYLMIDGIVFDANLRDTSLGTVSTSAAAATPIGMEVLGPSNGLVIEDTVFEYYKDNIDLEGVMGVVTNVTIRRSTIENSYCTDSKSQGLYAATVSGLTIDQDVFDHNGWNQSVSGAGATGYNHDIYCYDTVSGLSVTNSVIARASYAGVMARGGGVIDNNLFLDDGFGVVFGDANGAESTPGGVSGQIDGNVIMGNHALGSGISGGGIDIGNLTASAHVAVSGNVIADDVENTQAAIALDYAYATSNPTACVGLNNLTVSNNVVYSWHGGIQMATFTDGGSGLSSLSGLVVENNQIQNTLADLVTHTNAYNAKDETWSGNTCYAPSSASYRWFSMQGNNESGAVWQQTVDKTGTDRQLTYANAAATVETYNATLGGAQTETALMAAVDQQSDSHWIAGYTTGSIAGYLKAGFTVSSSVKSATAALTGTTIGTAGSYQNDGNTISKATSGSLTSFFDGPTANGNWVGLNLGSAKTIAQISFAPRAGFAGRMIGGEFQISNTPDFSSGVTTVYTINLTPAVGVVTTVTLSKPVTAEYVRYLSPAGSFGDVSALAFYG